MARRKHPLLPEREEYYPATVHAMRDSGGSLTIEEMEEEVAQRLKLSEAARSIPHGETNRTQFQYDLAWVRTYLKWGGAVENSERGVWHLTPNGRQMSDEDLRALWKHIVAEQRLKRSTQIHLAADGDEELNSVDRELPERTWKENLLDALLSIEPSAFERLCQRLLREAGFIKVEVTGRSGDGGIDGTGVLRMNLLSFHVLFQCKRWKGSVGASVVRDFRGAMVGRADKGLIITTGTFSADARKEATRDGAPAIDLLDGDALCDLLKSSKIGVKISLVEVVEVDASALIAV